MVKLLKGFVQQFLIILFYLKSRGTTWEDVLRRVQDDMPVGVETDPLSLAVHQAFADVGDGNLAFDPLDEMGKVMSSLLASKKKLSSDLIDSLVGAVSGPYSRNALSGPMLTAMRKALLLPDEVAGLTARLRKKELACAHCGHEYVLGEAVGIYIERDTVSVLCSTCYFPYSMRCRTCSGVAQFPSKLRDAMRKSTVCESCKNPKPKEEEKGEEVRAEVGGVAVAPPRGGYAEILWDAAPGEPAQPPQVANAPQAFPRDRPVGENMRGLVNRWQQEMARDGQGRLAQVQAEFLAQPGGVWQPMPPPPPLEGD